LGGVAEEVDYGFKGVQELLSRLREVRPHEGKNHAG